MVKANTEIDFVPDISKKDRMTNSARFKDEKTFDILEEVLTAELPNVRVVPAHHIYVVGVSQESRVHAVEPIKPPPLRSRDGGCEYTDPDHEQ
jgi:hypothetical protein